jgi:hypothetical protein
VSKPIEEMTLEEIQAEREEIARQREEMRAENERITAIEQDVRARREAEADTDLEKLLAPPNTERVIHSSDNGAGPEYPAVAIEGAFVEGAALAAAEDNPKPEPKPEPWPHDHLVHEGLELEVRIPNQSALMAISMLQQLDGLGELQMEIFNTFLANHLSRASLAKVIMEFTRPDTEMTIQSLVQALVNLRIKRS